MDTKASKQVNLILKRPKAYLILADGSVFEGKSMGVAGETIGEVVFTTAMAGYMETLTDPSYIGQIVLQTFPLIGNYGAITADSESDKPALSGYIVRELCFEGSNFRKECELGEYLEKNNIVGICDLDTREITRKIRNCGVMNGMICQDKKNLDEKLEKIRRYKIVDAVKRTSTTHNSVLGEKDSKFNIVLWDFGAKLNIDRELLIRGCKVTRVPYLTTADEIMSLNPDGVMLSNGGGDPADNAAVISEIKKLMDKKIPMFGICLGHQLISLASGGKTQKLKYGHRGANQPVKDLQTGRVFVTSQNHGYATVLESLDKNICKVRFINANDGTVEGIDYIDLPVFSVQFHPEACGGPMDTKYLFDRFLEMVSLFRECK